MKLPIHKVIPEIIEKLKKSNRLVLQSPPGTGKTTQVPLNLINSSDLKEQKILMLVPRRPTARTCAEFMARQTSSSVGDIVGYQIRGEKKLNSQTKVEIITEGILTRRLQADPELKGVGIVIFDEFHERSLHCDLALALLLEVQENFRSDLKIIIMSATLDGLNLESIFKDAQYVECFAKMFPVQVEYHPVSKQMDLINEIKNTIVSLVSSEDGDLLVFLPGRKEIFQLEQLLKDANLDEVYLLYGGISSQLQQKAILPDAEGRQKIVLATNIAETGLTIEGITCVLDSGLCRKPYVDPATDMSVLKTVTISKANSEQRKGRAGRITEGRCIRFWSENDQLHFKEQLPPEIMSNDLTHLVLETALWGVTNPNQLNWCDSPPEQRVQVAQKTLRMLRALDDEGNITAHGKKLLKYGVHPRLANILHYGEKMAMIKTAAEIVTIIEQQNSHFFNKEEIDIAEIWDDYISYSLNKKSQKYHFSLKKYQSWNNNIQDLLRKINCDSNQKEMNINRLDDKEYLGILCSYGFMDRVGIRRTKDSNRYKLAFGRGVQIPRDCGDRLCKEEFIVAPIVKFSSRDAPIILACSISKKHLLEYFKQWMNRESMIEWDHKNEDFRCFEKLNLMKIEIQSQSKLLSSEQFRESFLKRLLDGHTEMLPFDKNVKQLEARLNFLKNNLTQYEWPNISKDSSLWNDYFWLELYIQNISSMKEIQNLELSDIIFHSFDQDIQERILQWAPLNYKTPALTQRSIDYIEGEEPFVRIPIQELFGLKEHPVLAMGKVRLKIGLLNPGNKIIQVTSHIENFWKGSYLQIRKELISRYPKHHWPEDPSIENARKVSLKKKF